VRRALEGVAQRPLELQERPGGEHELPPLLAHPLEGAIQVLHDVLEMAARLDLAAPVDLGQEALEARLLDAVDGELGRTRQDGQVAERRNEIGRVELVLEDQAPPPAAMRGDLQPVGAAGLPGRQVQMRAARELLPEVLQAERVQHLEREAGRHAFDRTRPERAAPQRADEADRWPSDGRWQHRSLLPAPFKRAERRPERARPAAGQPRALPSNPVLPPAQTNASACAFG
jgi:hypothetical protein